MDPDLETPGPRQAGAAAMALGALLLVCGLMALSLTAWATVAAVLAIGGLLIAAGVGHIAGGFVHRHPRTRFAGIASGILSVGAGICFIVEPALGAVALTALLAAYFLVGGGLRLAAALRRREGGRSWAVASGFAAITLGVIALLNWPLASLWFVGTLVGVDFLFAGVHLIATGVALRRLLPAATAASELRRHDERSRMGFDDRPSPPL